MADVMIDDLDGCVVTVEDTQRELLLLERELSKELDLDERGIRLALLAREIRGELKHCDLVARWQQAYASFQDWMSEEAESCADDSVIADEPAMAEAPPKPEPEPEPSPPRRRRESRDGGEAADNAASSFLCLASPTVAGECRWTLSKSDISLASSRG
jgi:hypothetical protein